MPRNYNKPLRVVVDKTLRYEYFMDQTHPLGDKKGRVWFHRHVASVTLGRWVTSDEVVHHGDGARANNAPGNLEVTTASAHAREHAIERGHVLEPIACGACGEMFQPPSRRVAHCSVVCGGRSRQKFTPSKEDLEELVWLMPTTKVARRFGVSDVAVAKRCKALGIDKPPRGYWAGRS